MDVVRPKSSGNYPGIVLIHGGGFSGGMREGYLPMAIRLAQNGYVAATRQLPAHANVPVPVAALRREGCCTIPSRQCEQILAWIKSTWRAIGASAGATCSQFLAITRNMPQFEGTGANREESSSVDCAISYYGRPIMRRAYEGSRNAAVAASPLVGGDRMHALEAHFRGEPVELDHIPIRRRSWLIHGTRDQKFLLNSPYGWWNGCGDGHRSRSSRRSPKRHTDSRAPMTSALHPYARLLQSQAQAEAA